MAAYGNIDHAKAGLIDGLNYMISTLAVQADDTFDFGDPVFVEEGNVGIAHFGDNTESDLVFAGAAVISQRSTVENQGDYPGYDAMNVMNMGRIWVRVPTAEAALGICYKKAYVIDLPSDADYGKFSSIDTWYGNVGIFMSEPILVGDEYLAIVELHGVRKGDASET